KPNLEIHSIFNGFTEIDKFLVGFDRNNIIFEINNQNIKGWVKDIDYCNSSSVSITWQPKTCYINALKVSDSKKINSLFFHLFDLIGDSEFFLEWNNWKLNFNLNEIEPPLQKKSRRNLFIGCLTTCGNTNFSIKDANNFLHALTYFFSFCMGRWCNPFSQIGFNRKDVEIWKVWSTPKTEYKYVDSWINNDYCHEQYKELFPLFMDAWSNETLRETLKITIYWYITANTIPEIEAKVILMQSALERLSYDYIVIYRKLITDKGFENLKPASEKIRLLFTLTNSKINIPSELNNLINLKKYSDSPHVITDIRNSVIHPKQKSQISSIHIEECADMIIWYYELTLLNILGYKGKYQNRLQSYVNYNDMP
ncbi:TPA: hypothetical protein KKX36_003087, partial [Legionella pneumophila]|nr:hypothetical protein [Legionella pneumophila]